MVERDITTAIDRSVI